jgi:citrate synthase
MSETAELKVGDKTYELPIVTGTTGERAVDISHLRADSGLITLDDGYGNTGSCESEITFINGEKGILRYRGIPIEQLAEHSSFVETAYLLIFGHLPNKAQLEEFQEKITKHSYVHERLRHHFAGFPSDAPPMASLSAMVNALGAFERQLFAPEDDESFLEIVAHVISKIRTIAAMAHRTSHGLPINYPRSDQSYCGNFLHMMFCMPNQCFQASDAEIRALDQILILHADHEQNCSTSTVRMVGSSQANLFASVAAGICALWGPLHGGANVKVIEMLSKIHESGESIEDLVKRVKKREFLLMGFGHRVYKNFDPRAQIIKKSCDEVLAAEGVKDPLLDLAKELEEVALKDEFFIERKLYPNVDFYSGIIMRALNIPVEMFTVIFAIGRMPGWIANWREVNLNPKGRINRPRQIYQGPAEANYVPIDQR